MHFAGEKQIPYANRRPRRVASKNKALWVDPLASLPPAGSILIPSPLSVSLPRWVNPLLSFLRLSLIVIDPWLVEIANSSRWNDDIMIIYTHTYRSRVQHDYHWTI